MLATSMILRWFSIRSEGVKPSSWLSPWRTRSPSTHKQGIPKALYRLTKWDARVVFPAPDRPNSQMIFSFDANASSNVPIQTVSLTEPLDFLRIFLDLRASVIDGIGRYKVSPDFGNIGRYIFFNSGSPVTHRSRGEAVTSFLLRTLVFLAV